MLFYYFSTSQSLTSQQLYGAGHGFVNLDVDEAYINTPLSLPTVLIDRRREYVDGVIEYYKQYIMEYITDSNVNNTNNTDLGYIITTVLPQKYNIKTQTQGNSQTQGSIPLKYNINTQTQGNIQTQGSIPLVYNIDTQTQGNKPLTHTVETQTQANIPMSRFQGN